MTGIPLLLNDVTTGNTKFIGDLEAAKKVAYAERRIDVLPPTENNPEYRVYFHDGFDETPAEWGQAATLDQAWRFALGALFGPIDSEYDEDHLRAVLLDAALS